MYWHLWSLFAQAMNEVYGYPNSMRWYERQLVAKARAADTTGELQSAIAEAVERARERKAINAKYNAARDMQWFQEVSPKLLRFRFRAKVAVGPVPDSCQCSRSLTSTLLTPSPIPLPIPIPIPLPRPCPIQFFASVDTSLLHLSSLRHSVYKPSSPAECWCIDLT